MREHMRTILLAGLVIIMIFAFAGCSGSDTDQKSTSESTESQTTTETTTETGEADGYDIMEGFKLQENGSELLLYGNDFLLIMPNDDEWGYEQTSPSNLEIYYKEAREDGFGGHLVTIMAFDPEDESYVDFPDYAVAGTGKNVNKKFIALFPTDVQFNPEDSEQEEEYMELYNHVKKISEGMANSPFQTADSD